MSGLSLRGITWNYSRALPPLVAAAQRFEEQHPQIRFAVAPAISGHREASFPTRSEPE